jgi:PAS domain S-box-containing protein
VTLLRGLETRVVYVTLSPAVAIAAIATGPIGGLVALGMSAILAHVVIAPIALAADWLGLEAFLFSGCATVGMAELLRLALKEAALAKSIERSESDMRLFVDQAPAALAMFDKDMRYLASSARWKSDYGIVDSVVGRSHYEVVPDSPERWKDIHRRAMAGETIKSEEDVFVHADRPTQWLRWEVRPWHHPRDGIGGVTVFSEDITARKAAESAAKIDEERFRVVAKATDAVIFDSNVATGKLWWSDELKTVFGYDPADLESGVEKWHSLIHPDDRERVVKDRYSVGPDAKKWETEYRLIRADQSVASVVVRGFILRDEQGKIARLVGAVMDVTERKETDAKLRQAQKLEAVGQLTGGVAHDFNNLLTVILGNAEELSERLSNDGKLRILAEMTATAAERGAELTKRLLAFARKQPLEPKSVDVAKLLADMDGMLRRTLMENIEIEMVRGGGLWQALIDPGQLETAVLNLAINARDAMPEGGRLTLETSNASLDDAYAHRHDEVTPGQYVLISVSDTGTGMNAETLARAFEPFFTTKAVGKGSGLGLSMVYGFIKQSKGHVNIYSEPVHGTTIKLYLPRAVVDVGHDGSEGSIALPPRGSEKILVVEDDDLVRDFVLQTVRGLGYAAIGASDGPEALRILAATPDIELLFTDVVMPGGMNGRQLAEKATATRANLRVLFTSGYTENAIVHHGRLDRGVHLLSKPYRKQELATKLRSVLDER